MVMTYTVTQADRDAAMDGYHSFFEVTPNEGWEKAMLAGKHDDDCVVQAFARHRIETLERAAEVAKRNHDYETEDAIRALKGKSDE